MVQKIPDNLYKKILRNMPICCVDIVIQDEKGILLVYRKNEPVKNTWWLPGGRIYKDEKIEDAVLRKAFEETGLKVQIKNKIGVYETIFDDNPFMENSVDCVAVHSNSPDREFEKKSNQILCNDSSFGVHTINICFLVEASSHEVKLDNQSSDFKWINKIENTLPEYVKNVISDSKVFN